MEAAKHFDLNRQVSRELRKVRYSLQNNLGILNMWIDVLEDKDDGISEPKRKRASCNSVGNKQPKGRKKA